MRDLDRRSFASLLISLLASRKSTSLAVAAADKSVKVSGEFNFHTAKDGLVVDLKDVSINGLSIPALTWSWLGLAVAQGFLAGFGTAIFGAIANAIFGQQGRSIEQLLREQLIAFAQIVNDELLQSKALEYAGEIDGYTTLFRDYQNDQKDIDKLNYLTNGTAITLGKLKTLQFVGYRTYMVAAGLRLAALQQSMKIRKNSSAQLKDQRRSAIAFHNEIQSLIENATSVETLSRRFGLGNFGGGSLRQIYVRDGMILSEHIAGSVLIDANSMQELTDAETQLTLLNYAPGLLAGPRFSLRAVRSRLVSENTARGELMIAKWNRVRLA